MLRLIALRHDDDDDDDAGIAIRRTVQSV